MRMTFKNGTMTTKGMIAHKKHPQLGFEMPVMLSIVNGSGLNKPMKLLGKLVYAMPGGGTYW